MNSLQLKAIEENFAELVEALDVHHCVTMLRAQSIITIDQCQIINSLTTSRQQIIAVIGFVKGVDCWDKFLKTLRDGNQGFLANELQKSLDKLSTQNIITIPSTIDERKLIQKMSEMGIFNKILIDELLVALKINGTLHNSSFESINYKKTSAEKRLELFQRIGHIDGGWEGLYNALTKTNQTEIRDLIFTFINEK